MLPSATPTGAFDGGDGGDWSKRAKLTPKEERYKRKACDLCHQKKVRCDVCPSPLSILNEAVHQGRNSL